MTSLLAGQLQHILIVSVIDGAVLSWLALRWYRSSVRRLMAAPAARPVVVPSAAPVDGAPPTLPGTQAGATTASALATPSPLRFALFDADHPTAVAEAREGSSDASRRRVRRRLLAAYIAGAAAWSAGRTLTEWAPASESPIAVVWLVTWWIHLWLVVPSLVLLLGLTLRESIRAALAYLAIGAGSIALFTLAGQVPRAAFNTAPVTNVYHALVFLAHQASLPAPILLMTGLRTVRAVMPLALAGVAVFGIMSLFFREALILAFNAPALRSAILGAAGMSSTGVAYYGLFMIVALPAGWLAWRLLRRIAAAFERRQFSDVQLIVDCWWAVLTIEQSAVLAVRYEMWAIPMGLGLFALYRTTVALMLRAWRRRLPADASATAASEASPQRLTLLRVFGYQRRTEALFDRIGRQWRFLGPVQLIAGTDLAVRTTDPGDMLAFVQGQLASRYIRHTGEIATRIANLDLDADKDGRFRVNELYCHDDTWRPALQALLDVSDRVVADLRGFREHNAGCRFELEQLLGRVLPSHVVIVHDRTTDLALLGGILEDTWRTLPEETRRAGAPVLVRVERQTEDAVRLLVRCLTGHPPPSPAR